MYDTLVVHTRLANSLSKNRAEADASIKNLTGMHAKGRAEVNASTKNPTGMLAKDLAEEDASTKTLTVMPAKDLTGMHAKDLAEGSVSIKTLTGSRSKEGIGTYASIKTPLGYSMSFSALPGLVTALESSPLVTALTGTGGGDSRAESSDDSSGRGQLAKDPTKQGAKKRTRELDRGQGRGRGRPDVGGGGQMYQM